MLFGRIKRVSVDRTEITVALPRGGTMVCRNEGFRIGEEVCFVLDPSERHVIKVMPRDVAEVRAMLAADIYLQHAIMEPPELRPEDMVTNEPIFEEDCYEGIDATNESNHGQNVENDPDRNSGETGDNGEYPYDSFAYPDQIEN